MVQRHIVNRTAVALWALSWTTLKNSGEGKPSQKEELRGGYTVVHFMWRENSQLCDHILMQRP